MNKLLPSKKPKVELHWTKAWLVVHAPIELLIALSKYPYWGIVDVQNDLKSAHYFISSLYDAEETLQWVTEWLIEQTQTKTYPEVWERHINELDLEDEE
jgi:hypothetical protein